MNDIEEFDAIRPQTRRELMMLANLQTAIQPLVVSSESKEEIQKKLLVLLNHVVLYMGRPIVMHKLGLESEGSIEAAFARKRNYERSPCGYYRLEEVDNSGDTIMFKWVLND